MADMPTRQAPPSEFELFDNPRSGRIAGVATALLGAAFLVIVWWEFPQERTQQLWALFAVLVGACALGGGILLYRLSKRRPYLILRADARGLTLVEKFRYHREPVYVLLPWSQIRDFRLRAMGEAGYAMEVHDALPAEEEKRLRATQKFGSPPGILLFEIPLKWLPVREEYLDAMLHGIASRGREARA